MITIRLYRLPFFLHHPYIQSTTVLCDTLVVRYMYFR